VGLKKGGGKLFKTYINWGEGPRYVSKYPRLRLGFWRREKKKERVCVCVWE